MLQRQPTFEVTDPSEQTLSLWGKPQDIKKVVQGCLSLALLGDCLISFSMNIVSPALARLSLTFACVDPKIMQHLVEQLSDVVANA